MARKASTQPTDGELAILRVLWTRGASTVRDVQRHHPVRGVGYTTVLKLLQIMHAKGLVRRDEQFRTHLYSAAQAQEQVQNGLLTDLLHRAFGGSAKSMLVRALSATKASKQELRDVRMLLEQMERDPGGKATKSGDSMKGDRDHGTPA